MKKVTYKGKEYLTKELAAMAGVSIMGMRLRLQRGVPEELLLEPASKGGRKPKPPETKVAIYAILDSVGKFLYVGATINPMKECLNETFKWREWQFDNCTYKILAVVEPNSAPEIEDRLIKTMRSVNECVFNTNKRRVASN